MAPLRRRIRRAAVAVACVGLVATLAGCDSSGSGRAGSGTTTTSRRKPHGSTTTTSSTVSTSSTTGSGTATSTPPTSAAAAPLPCGTQEAALTALVQGGDLPIPVASYEVTDCRIA